MKHRRNVKRLGRTRGAKKALLRTLVRSLVLNGAIQTSSPKAKVLKPLVDRIVNIAKEGNLASRRRILAILGDDKEVVAKLIALVPQFSGRTSGYTRILPLKVRRGDNALVVRISWTDEPKASAKIKESEKTKEVTREEVAEEQVVKKARGKRVKKED